MGIKFQRKSKVTERTNQEGLGASSWIQKHFHGLFLYLKKLKFAFEKLTNQIAQRGSDGAGKRPRPGLPQPPRLLGAPLTQLIVPLGPCRAGPKRQAAVSKPGAPSVLPP